MHYSVSDCLLDLVQNSIEAKATTITLQIREHVDNPSLRCTLTDNGVGMTEEVLEQAKDPFYTDGEKHKSRKVGLGIPFLLQMVAAVDGDWHITSKPGEGTEVSFSLPMNHFDAPPMGSVVSLLVAAFTYGGEFELSVHRSLGVKSYDMSRQELLAALGDFETVDSLQLLTQFIEAAEAELT